MNIVAILANGVGERFGSNVPKQFHTINGKMVIEYVIESVLNSVLCDKVVIATNVEANSAYVADICKDERICIVNGGTTRNKTLSNVLKFINESLDCEKLIVCDAVRPMVTSELIDDYFLFLDGCSAVVTAQRITDSLGCYKFQKVNREDYYLMQSPEAFEFGLLFESFDEDSPLTEVTQQLPEESKIKLYFDFTNNFKLTYPADLKYLEALIREKENDIDFSSILKSATRLKNYLDVNYPGQSDGWITALEKNIPSLLKKWQIENYRVIKTSHFGIIFVATSIKYGECVMKIIPPFIERYNSECACYQHINSSYMCELYDYDDECCALLLEKCEDVDNSFSGDSGIIDFFEKVLNSEKVIFEKNQFKDYEQLLKEKIYKSDFSYQSDLIMNYVNHANKIYCSVFNDSEKNLIHGDLHRYNIMSKNEGRVAIDPIGYIAPQEFEIARYIGTELTDTDTDIKELYEAMLKKFSSFADYSRLKAALYIDCVFRLHNSIFENETFELTDKWIKVLSVIAL